MSGLVKFITVTVPNWYRPSHYIDSIEGTERYGSTEGSMDPEKLQAFKEWQAKAKVVRNVALTALALVAVGGVVTVGTLVALQLTGTVDLAGVQGMINVASGVFSGLRTVMTMGLEMQAPTNISNGFVNFLFQAGVSCYNSTILMGLAPVDFIPGGFMLATLFRWKVFKDGGLTTPGLALLFGSIGGAFNGLKPLEDIKELYNGTTQKISDISEEMFNSFYNRGWFHGSVAPIHHNIDGVEVVRDGP